MLTKIYDGKQRNQEMPGGGVGSKRPAGDDQTQNHNG